MLINSGVGKILHWTLLLKEQTSENVVTFLFCMTIHAPMSISMSISTLLISKQFLFWRRISQSITVFDEASDEDICVAKGNI